MELSLSPRGTGWQSTEAMKASKGVPKAGAPVNEQVSIITIVKNLNGLKFPMCHNVKYLHLLIY